MTDEPDPDVEALENRIESLESTIEKMMPSRRDALKMGGAAVVGAGAMTGVASAQPGDQDGEAGVIGTDNSPVDIEASDIEVDDLVVNGTATGPFGGGAPVLEAGDSMTVATVNKETLDETFFTLYDGSTKELLGGVIAGGTEHDFLYTFSDSSTLQKNGSGTTYSSTPAIGRDRNNDLIECSFLPPAKDITKIEIGGDTFGGAAIGATAMLKD